MSESRGNWGRWGADDERGTANLLSESAVLDALRVPTTGRTYSLGQPIQASGQPRSAGGVGSQIIPPIHLFMRSGLDHAHAPLDGGRTDFTVDFLATSVHGATTHIDALGHMVHEGVMYNGFDASTSTSAGLARCGIEKAPPLVMRGVLLDVAAVHEVEALPSDYAITVGDLEAAMERHGVEVRAGDAVLIRTGMYAEFMRDPRSYDRPHPGLGMDAGVHLAQLDVVVIGADNRGVEPLPYRGDTGLPVHRVLIVDHGIHLIEFMYLDELAEAGVHEFLFVAAPLRITGGSGSPLSPFAIA